MGGGNVLPGGVAMTLGSAHLAEFAFPSSLAASASWPLVAFLFVFFFLSDTAICLCLVLLFPYSTFLATAAFFLSFTFLHIAFYGNGRRILSTAAELQMLLLLLLLLLLLFIRAATASEIYFH